MESRVESPRRRQRTSRRVCRTGCSTLARWPGLSVATKKRFVAHTGADYFERNASVCEEGGLTHKTSSTGSVEEPQRKSCNRKENLYGCSKALPQQRLQVEPALRASVVVGCHAQSRTVPNARR